MTRLIVMVLGILVCTIGCDTPVGVDEPCEKDEDCDDGLECDLHDGEGTCQEPHDD